MRGGLQEGSRSQLPRQVSNGLARSGEVVVTSHGGAAPEQWSGTGVDGYGSSLVERARFIVETIRAHVRRLDCQVHTAERDDLELLLGRSLEWCPACGARVGPVIRTRAPRRGPGRPPRGVGDQGG